ncbi:hypothetical protein H6P81_013852 [Aristolochia fimbriata]|uniref:Uncharacterized protein n=1 Tax=Aristolochia fimbriata TaxID=158543 RepID=A0AAV7EGB1_ARIFI|nr:hypothetical protein H6P81_013852 [Aristolochia fimbriata]
MEEVPSLLSLCAKAITEEIIYGDHDLEDIFELPSDLFEHLVMHLPPVALHKLTADSSLKHFSSRQPVTNSDMDRRKRGRFGDFNAVWKTLFESRWPQGSRKVLPRNGVAMMARDAKHKLTIEDANWQQKYWEAHIQNCLDEAAETALLLSFSGDLGDIAISESVMKAIGFKSDIGRTSLNYSKLSYHCLQFGCYASCVRLQNVLCVSEIGDLLKDSKLHGLVFRSVKSKSHVDGACQLIKQNIQTLQSLEFIHCKLSPSTLSKICSCLCTKKSEKFKFQCFSIKSSSILESDAASMPSGFLSFLTERSLHALTFSDNHIGPDFAQMIFNTLVGASADLFALELSESNISGWLTKTNWKIPSCQLLSLERTKCLKSLHVLNLRGDNLNKDDIEDLKFALVHDYMPNLQSLDLSDNPFEDDGIRILISYFTEASEKASSLRELKLENCDLSYKGVAELLGTLSSLRPSLYALSVAGNELGSHVAGSLAKFLTTPSVRVLNIEDIGLGPSGFRLLGKEMPEVIRLVELNMSKNRGGMETAKFISWLVSHAPELVAVNAGYNFIPAESLEAISHALKLSKGKLEQLDLTGNTGCYQLPPHASRLLEFHKNGRPIVILPSSPNTAAPYDDDP